MLVNLFRSAREDYAEWVLRLGLAMVYVWFGALKVVGLSPATPLVLDLFNQTVPLVPFSVFFPAFSLFEVLIGVLFLVPRATRLAFALVVLHLASTVLPLAFLAGATWSGFLVPTMEGQYILKNVLIFGAAYALLARGERRR